MFDAANAPEPPRLEFCVTNETEQPIQGAWLDLAPHRRGGVQARVVAPGDSACGALPVTGGSPPVLRLHRAGGPAAGARCAFPAPAQGRRFAFAYHSNAEIGEHCELQAATVLDTRRP
jgi:hypothetical protein